MPAPSPALHAQSMAQTYGRRQARIYAEWNCENLEGEMREYWGRVLAALTERETEHDDIQ